MIVNFDQLFQSIENKSTRKLAVASAEGEETVQAVKQATQRGVIFPVLIGDQRKIEQACKKVGLAFNQCEIVDQRNPEATASLAVSLVREGKADMLMKGKVGTSILLKAVLDKEKGLRSGGLLSHVAVVEIKSYHKFLLITDGGMNIKPDVTKKVEIILNAVDVAKKLGIETPKVACLTAVETVNTDMQETIDASVITKMAERGDMQGAVVDGPIALDVAIDSRSAEMKGIDSPVAGDTDIFLVPDITSGNILVKGLIYLANAKVGGIVVGAGVPIVLLSRSDSAETKLYSIALGAAIC